MDQVQKVVDQIPQEVKDFDLARYVDRRIVSGLSLYGAYVLCSYFAKPLFGQMSKALTFRKDLKQRYEGAEWVIVAGGTEVIGQALCHEFAKAGFNIILISKSNIEATKVAKTVKKDYGVQATIIKYDFGALTTQQEAEKLKATIDEKTKGKNVGILVNNVTLSSSESVFHRHNFSQLVQMISANVFAQSVMTRIMAGKWLEERKGKQCLVIDYASGATAGPLAVDPLYAGSKSYAQILSRSLAAQYEAFSE